MSMIVRKLVPLFAIVAMLAPAMARAQDAKPADAPVKSEVQKKEAEAAYLDAMVKLKEARAKAEAEAVAAANRAKEAQAQAEAKAKEAKNQVAEALRSLEAMRGAKLAIQSPRRTMTRVTTANRTGLPAADALQAAFGLKLAAPDDALRAQLDLPKGQGVVILESKPGALADQAGLKPNDVILLLANDPINSVNEARDVLLKLGKMPVQVKLIRAGKPRQLALVGPEHGIVEPTEYWVGIPVAPIDATLRSHLTDLPADTGLIATDVVAKSPAEVAGVQKNDVLISLGGKPLKVRESLTAAVQASEGKPVVLEVIRAGKPVSLTVTPGKRPVTQTGVNMLENFLVYRSVDPKLGIAVEGRASIDPAKPADASPAKPFTLDLNVDFDQDDLAILQISDATRKAVADMIAGKYKDPQAKADESIQAALKALQASIDSLRKQVDEMAKPEKK